MASPFDPRTLAVLSNAEMYRADGLAAEGGVPGPVLMESAGAAVAQAIRHRWAPRPLAVLCGPGNNGGDGFVAARLLAEAGWPVRLACLVPRERLKGDAAHHAQLWQGPVEALDRRILEGAGLVVDAMFGAGLARPLEGEPAALAEALSGGAPPVVAVDVPSGVRGDDGTWAGPCVKAALTVTFFRKKPAHLLMPSRIICGDILVRDIGIPLSVLDRLAPRLWENGPALWLESLPRPAPDGHKYDRGHAVVLGGAAMTGAARLAARAAMRAGAGLVTVAAPPEAIPIYAADRAGILTSPLAAPGDFAACLADPRRNAVLAGPGSGVSEGTRRAVLDALAATRATVLDADALSAFGGSPERLFGSVRSSCVLTPHDGEFRRLFPDLSGDRLSRARAAASRSGAVVLLKGRDSTVAHPDGRAAITANAPPDLATAGAGDVLAGMILGLLAQGVPAFEAACAASWIHGEAAAGFGPGLVADDLPDLLPPVLARLRRMQDDHALLSG